MYNFTNDNDNIVSVLKNGSNLKVDDLDEMVFSI
jgi:hypothetical protein